MPGTPHSGSLIQCSFSQCGANLMISGEQGQSLYLEQHILLEAKPDCDILESHAVQLQAWDSGCQPRPWAEGLEESDVARCSKPGGRTSDTPGESLRSVLGLAKSGGGVKLSPKPKPGR